MKIRQEEKRDYEAVYLLIKEAFREAEHRDGKEQDLVVALRNSEAFVPQLSLVAEEEGKLIGYILFTKIGIGEGSGLALAPLAVHPAHQKKGIGRALMEEGHKIAAALGYGSAVVLGSETYYPKAGYQPAEEVGIYPPFDVPSANFMARRLRQDAEPVAGMVKYAAEFGI